MLAFFLKNIYILLAAALCASLPLPDKIFQPTIFSHSFLFFSTIVRVCFKAVIQSSKMPEIALFSLKNRKNPLSAGGSALRPLISPVD